MERRIYRLEPYEGPDGPSWQRAPWQGTVIVRADSAADARILAAEAEDDFLEAPVKPEYGVSTRFASSFRDEKLYHVVEDLSGRYPNDGPREVIEGPANPHVIRR
jgi:hypothetical protein